MNIGKENLSSEQSRNFVQIDDGDTILLPTQRFAYIDLLEALAISFVVIYHVGLYSKNIVISPSPITYFSYSLTGILSTCVPVFFLVNGFLLFGKSFDLRRHLKKTGLIIGILFFWRFIIPLVLILVVGQEFDLTEYLAVAWNFKVGWNNQLWFLETLICIYIAFPLLKLAFDSQRRVFIFFLIVCAVCSFGNTLLNELATIVTGGGVDNKELVRFNFFKGINLFAGINGYAFVYFCVGGILRDKLNLIRNIPTSKRILTSVAMFVISLAFLTAWGVYASFLEGNLWDNVIGSYNTVFTFGMTVSLFSICVSYRGSNKTIYGIVKLISTNTMGIFILHYPINAALVSLLPQLFTAGSILRALPGWALYDLFIITTSLLLALFLKRIPFMRKLV